MGEFARESTKGSWKKLSPDNMTLEEGDIKGRGRGGQYYVNSVRGAEEG